MTVITVVAVVCHKLQNAFIGQDIYKHDPALIKHTFYFRVINLFVEFGIHYFYASHAGTYEVIWFFVAPEITP